MESAPLLIDPQGAGAGVAGGESSWVMEPDEEINGTSGWSVPENTPFFFLAQPIQGEVFDRIEYDVGAFQLIGPVQRTTTERFIFQAGDDAATTRWYPDEIVKKYWHEAPDDPEPEHVIEGSVIRLKVDDPQLALDITYKFTALQFKAIPPKTELAEETEFVVPFDLYGRIGD